MGVEITVYKGRDKGTGVVAWLRGFGSAITLPKIPQIALCELENREGSLSFRNQLVFLDYVGVDHQCAPARVQHARGA